MTDVEDFDPEFRVDNFYIGGTVGFYKYSEIQGVPKVETAVMAAARPYTIDKNNPSVVIVNVYQGTNQVYLIEK